METHLERVRFARFLKENESKFEISWKHIIIIGGSFTALFAIAFLGAMVPEFYHKLGRIPPKAQILGCIIPLAIFGFWRLKKMTRP